MFPGFQYFLMKHLLSCVSLLLFSLPSLISGLYAGTKVTEINSRSFDKIVLKNERAIMLEFYAPNCGYCKRLVPDFSKLAENLEGIVDIMAIDCTGFGNEAICGRYHVQGYPTIKLFKSAGKENNKISLDYNGDRSLSDMTRFIKKNMHSFIFSISLAFKTSNDKWKVSLDSFFAKGKGLPKLILITQGDLQSPSLLFRAISIKYHYKVVVGVISTKKYPEITTIFNLKPNGSTLLYFHQGNRDAHVTYEGKEERNEIFKFLDGQLSKDRPKSDKDEL